MITINLSSIEAHLPLLTLAISSTIALINVTLAIMRELRERRKERNERLQLEEQLIHKNGAYPPRKDKHHKR